MNSNSLGYFLVAVAMLKSIALLLFPYVAMAISRRRRAEPLHRHGYSSPLPFWEVVVLAMGYFLSTGLSWWILIAGLVLIFASYIQLWLFSRSSFCEAFFTQRNGAG